MHFPLLTALPPPFISRIVGELKMFIKQLSFSPINNQSFSNYNLLSSFIIMINNSCLITNDYLLSSIKHPVSGIHSTFQKKPRRDFQRGLEYLYCSSNSLFYFLFTFYLYFSIIISVLRIRYPAPGILTA